MIKCRKKKKKKEKEKKNQQTAPLKCGAGGAKAENAMCDDFPLNSKQQQQEAQRKICRTTANQKTIIKCRSRTLTPSLAPAAAAAAAASVSRFIKEH